MTGSRPDSRSGMVLLEVILALMIFTGVAFSLVMALDAATDAATDRNHIDAAVQGLENQMAQATQAHVGEVTRDLPADGSGILYHLEISPEALTDDQNRKFTGFFRIHLTASWREGSRQETRELSELKYQP